MSWFKSNVTHMYQISQIDAFLQIIYVAKKVMELIPYALVTFQGHFFQRKTIFGFRIRGNSERICQKWTSKTSEDRLSTSLRTEPQDEVHGKEEKQKKKTNALIFSSPPYLDFSLFLRAFGPPHIRCIFRKAQRSSNQKL